MTNDQIIANLENTIEGKTALLANLTARAGTRDLDGAVTVAMIHFLEVNIIELQKILIDVKKAKQ